jgi:hypothetical protein
MSRRLRHRYGRANRGVMRIAGYGGRSIDLTVYFKGVHIALTRAPGARGSGYGITHIPSGALLMTARTLRQGKKAIAALEALGVDWGGDRDSLNTLEIRDLIQPIKTEANA